MELLDEPSQLVELVYLSSGYDPCMFRTTDGSLFKNFDQAVAYQRALNPAPVVEDAPSRSGTSPIPIPARKKIVDESSTIPGKRRTINTW